ncbi:hypothetical protein [Woeseia oceani]|uniref:Uncharacterized protein n=1 Tax=Woeseia oceani TaxID=1548547 RepID=A0A193LHS7_9GAMM|nr:hypothetical protein [Woeseia oceani]ANO52080.1 hypothetical protein BA177_13515 [Woeseia oceani]
MNGMAKVVLLAVPIGLFLWLFDVSLNPEFALPADVKVADPMQEQLYERCFAAEDAVIHEQAFGTIDNPDVQREFISMHREDAHASCRQRYPERLVDEHRGLQFNLIDLRYRFAD